MRFTGPQLQELRDALISAYPTRPSLEQMVRFKLNENLHTITGDGNLDEIVFNLINWAEARGRLEELVSKAHAANSGNPQLRAFVDRMQPLLPRRLSHRLRRCHCPIRLPYAKR